MINVTIEPEMNSSENDNFLDVPVKHSTPTKLNTSTSETCNYFIKFYLKKN